MKMNQINSVCVYSASSTKIDAVYFQAADTLGYLLAEHRIRLINGAGSIGLMRSVADAVLKNGGEVTGVIPRFMVEQNWHHTGLTELIEVESMHERKRKMADLSDGIIALPGGCGTLEELLEIITWKQLGLYLNPIVILNINGFFDPLLEMLEKAIDENFMRRQHGDIWKVAQTPEEAVQLLYETPVWDISIRKFAAICDTLSSRSADTLSLFRQDQISPAKADTDSLQLTDLRAVQEVDSGFEGTPISYSPRTDDAIALTLLACFFLSSIALARGKRFLSQQVKDFVLHRERTSIFDSSTAADVRYLLVLVLQTCVLSGITFLNYFHDTSPTLMNQVSPLLLLGIYVGFCLAYFLLKWLIYMFLGWTFFDKNKTNIWLESYSALIYYVGFALFPFVLFLVYFDLSLTNLVIIGSIILIFTKILMFYKWIKLFFHQFSGLFLLILYFCALEIVPCLLLYQGMIQMNNILLIKF